MKKVLLLIISVISVLSAYAQDVDTLQVQSSSTSIDSLSLKLEKLQHDFDYLSCEHELFKLKMELDALAQDINIKTNGLLIDVYHTRYDKGLYTSFSENYDACCSLFDSLKDRFEHVKTFAVYKVVTSDFSDTEIGVLDSYLDSIQHSIAVIDSGLNYYDAAIQTYKKKR